MDQLYQLQRQIQDLRQEVNAISQVASQLQRSEANNIAQLQRLQQHESMATQQLQTIQQLCNRLSQDVNAISSIAQQFSAQIAAMPFTTGQFGAGTYNQYGTGQFGQYGAGITTGYYSPVQAQFPTYGTQFGTGRTDEFSRNQLLSSMAQNRYGLGFNVPDYISNQYISSMANQGMLGSQSSFPAAPMVTGMAAGAGQSGYAQAITGNFTLRPEHPVGTSQYGTTTMAGQYSPSYQMGFASQPTSGMYTTQSQMGAQNIGLYSNF